MKTKFICVQPIQIKTNKLLESFSKTIINKKDFNKIKTNKIPKWMEEFNNISDILYEHTICLELENIDNNIIIEDINLKKNITTNDVNYYLIFDTNLLYFILYIEFDFEFEKEEYIVDSFYSKIRNLIVKENDSTMISQWTIDLLKESKNKIQKLYKLIYKIDLTIEDIIIKNNTGNISNIIDISNVEKDKKKKISNYYISLNKKEDRLNNNNVPLNLNDTEKFFFNGRFHTVIVNNNKNVNRYIPILFQMQYNWFYTFILTKIHSEINIKILSNNLKGNFQEQKKFLKTIINKILIFESSNEIFKFSIESDKEEIYDKIEGKWSLEKTISNLISYVKKYEKYLKEEYINHLNLEKAKSKNNTNKLLKEIDKLDKERRLLENDMYKDHLTRAYNRKKFEIDTEDLFDINYEEFYLCFIDGDKFKNINDTFGHQAGDEVLKRIINTIFKVMQENKVQGEVYRFGGEEFLIIIYNEKDTSIIGILNLIKDSIEDTVVEHNKKQIKFTISIGATKSNQNDSIEDMVERSDLMVYKAKENGRNRIEKDF